MPYNATAAPLIAAEAFSARLAGKEVACALAAGLIAEGSPQPDMLEIADSSSLDELLASSGFDARMRASRALVLAVGRLRREDLPRSPAFELATRARQAGVPAYAVSVVNTLEPFDARILDLQMILEASGRKSLQRAGRLLAGAL